MSHTLHMYIKPALSYVAVNKACVCSMLTLILTRFFVNMHVCMNI